MPVLWASRQRAPMTATEHSVGPTRSRDPRRARTDADSSRHRWGSAELARNAHLPPSRLGGPAVRFDETFTACFTKTCTDEDDRLRVESNRSFEMLLGPRINTNTPACPQDSNRARTGTIDDGKGPSPMRGVELGGFEPPTSSMPWKRATNCAIAPASGRHPAGRRG